MWQQVPSSNDFPWQDAVDYCNSLELGGYSGWRIPSLKELFSTENFSPGRPYLDRTYFNLASDRITIDEQCWSSNYYMGTTRKSRKTAGIVGSFVGAFPISRSPFF